MPQNRPRPPRNPRFPPPRDPRPGGNGRLGPVPLAAMAIGIYFFTLWFGITVVGDTAPRSALMAGLILGIASVGYVVSGRTTPPNK